jgi:hypothetical protein
MKKTSAKMATRRNKGCTKDGQKMPQNKTYDDLEAGEAKKKKKGINKTRTTKQAEHKIKHEKKRRKAKLARRHEGNTHLLLHKMESRSKSLADIHQERSSMIQQLRKQRMLGLRLSDSSSYKKEEQREKN